MSAAPNQVVRFGVFEVDLRTGELRKAGVRVSLPEQPFQVLKALLDRPGQLVTREELRGRLWQAETFVDFEHGLNAAVRRLRDALGDSADRSRFVETLPRRGYRFIAPVGGPSTPEQPAPAAVAIENPYEVIEVPVVITTAAPVSRMTRLLTASILGVVAILTAGGYLLWRQALSPSPASASRSMLAVLPFENLTGDPDQEYISDGLTEEMIAQLGGMDPSRLGVIARRSAMHFKTTIKRADEIGRDLGASHILEGSLRRTGNRVRVAVQLVETRTQSQLWGGQYEHDGNDLLTLQREIAAAVSRQVVQRLGATLAHAAVDDRRHTTSTEAYDHYLRGRYQWRKETSEGFEKAKEHFRRAIALDPSYAHAYSGLADTYTMLGSIGLLPVTEAYPLGRAAALKALELDGQLAEAHTSLAGISTDYDWDWDAADHHFKRAIELNPNYEEALRFYSSYLGWRGRHDEALGFASRARDLDPASPNARYHLGLAHYFARRYDEAITQFLETLDLDPHFGAAHVMLGRVWVARGQPERALDELARARSLLGSRPDVVTPNAYVLAKAGRGREALASLDELQRISTPRSPAPFRIAYVYVGLGDKDRAFEWLHRAIEARDWQLGMLNVEPAFDGLRSDPRFAALLGRVGLP